MTLKTHTHTQIVIAGYSQQNRKGEIMNISIKRNNDRSLKVVATNQSDGSVHDITDWTIHFTVKKNRSDKDSAAIIRKTVTTHTDPTQGISHIVIDANDTKSKEVGTYYYDLLIVDENGKRHSTQTGIFELEQEVSDGDA